jgi:deoxyribonuclease V
MDCAFTADGRTVVACAVVLERTAGGKPAVAETRTARRPVRFPYVPGLLSFREAPACLAAAAKLARRPDVFMIDGQGIAHPRRLGLACHLGLFLDSPTIGCAKSRLVGDYRPPGTEKGSRSRLADRGAVIGAVVRTRANVKPVFVSVGHRCSLDDAVRIVLEWTTRYRLPEPTRLAHILVGRARAGG